MGHCLRSWPLITQVRKETRKHPQNRYPSHGHCTLEQKTRPASMVVLFRRSVVSSSLQPRGLSWVLSFKPAFTLSSFTFIKRLFSSSLLSVIRVVSFPYLRLLIFLLAILNPACTSSNLAFCMMYSAYNLPQSLFFKAKSFVLDFNKPLQKESRNIYNFACLENGQLFHVERAEVKRLAHCLETVGPYIFRPH